MRHSHSLHRLEIVPQPAKNPTFTAITSNSTGKPTPRWPKSAGPMGNRPSGCWKCGQAGHIKRNCILEDAPAADSTVQQAVAPGKSAPKRGAAGLDNAEVYWQMELHGKSIPCLVDTGCEITHPHSYAKPLPPAAKLVLIYRPRRDGRLSWPEAWDNANSFAPRLLRDDFPG